jgi:hypothetical protein
LTLVERAKPKMLFTPIATVEQAVAVLEKYGRVPNCIIDPKA